MTPPGHFVRRIFSREAVESPPLLTGGGRAKKGGGLKLGSACSGGICLSSKRGGSESSLVWLYSREEMPLPLPPLPPLREPDGGALPLPAMAMLAAAAVWSTVTARLAASVVDRGGSPPGLFAVALALGVALPEPLPLPLVV